ncbi:reverse transcriptase [Hirsutella rhossiliensis]
MDISELGVTNTSKQLIRDLLSDGQSVPQGTLFDDDIFVDACRNLENKNEARIIQDISRLIVPSAESLALRNKNYKRLVESVNEGWNNSIPLTNTRPQPDYSVGFKRDAFTEDQLAKLSPFIGDFIAGDQSFFMATYYMYFPFLTSEVKCGAAALDIADRQNAHSMTLAVRAIVELFRAIKREDRVNRKILAFSVSHDHSSVRIYGHYPVIAGKDIKYYRHPIHKFDFTALDGKDRWTAYRFTKNVYDTWMPKHFENICSAINQLPSDLDFDVPPLSGATGLSQDLGNLVQSGYSGSAGEQDSQSSIAEQQAVTPDTSFSGGAKRRKGRKLAEG